MPIENEDEMSTEEVATLFGESVPVEKVSDPNDIYAIAARVKNLATGAINANLTPTGVSLCNSFVHVLKPLYDFAETLPEDHKSNLKTLLSRHESMPAAFIASHQAQPRPSIVPHLDPRGEQKQYQEDPEVQRLLNLLEANSTNRMIPMPEKQLSTEPTIEPVRGFWPKVVNWFLE